MLIIADLPPLLIQVGDAETLLDDSNRVAARAKEHGVKVELEVWDDMVHVGMRSRRFFPKASKRSIRSENSCSQHTP